MALIHLDFESQYYNANTDVYVIIPDKKRGIDPKDFYKREDRFKCLWLLHGTFGSYSDWIRKSNIELYACEHDLMVVMPSVQNFDYEEWDNAGLGLDTTRMIVDELMPMIQNWFPASDKREDNFIAGLSMGGGGAIKLALNYPEKFSACACLSSTPRNLDARKADLEKLFALTRKEAKTAQFEDRFMGYRNYNQMHRYDSVDEYLDSISNSWRKLDSMVAAKDPLLPRLFFSIGTEDFGYANFKLFKAHLEELGVDAVFTEGPGVHEWRVWERDIQKAITFFGLDGDDVKGNAF